MDAPGKGMLKVVSILFIIFGAIATIVSIVALVGSAVLTAYTEGLAGIFIVGSIILLLVSVLELIVGIIGLKKCADPAQAGFFIVTGIVLCVLGLVSMIMTLSSFQVTSLISFVLPILYIVGGFMNKNAKTA
jgi:hypothetical protein